MKRAEYQVMYDIEDDFWWYAGMRQAVAAMIDRQVLHGVPARQSIPLRILDAGSGTGKNLSFLRRYGPTFGIELAGEGIRLARQRGPLSMVQGTIAELPFGDATFDLLTSFEVIYHLGVADDQAALTEFARVVRPGGYVLLRVPAYDWLRGSHDCAVQTRHRYTLGELKSKVELAGLVAVQASYLNVALFPVAAAKRVAEAIVGSGSESDLKPIVPFLNAAFTATLAVEGRIASVATLPFGLSALVLARKP